MPDTFALDLISVGDCCTYDDEVGVWLCDVGYGKTGNNLILQLPAMKIKSMSLLPQKSSHRIKLYAECVTPNKGFLGTFRAIEERLVGLLKSKHFGSHDIDSRFLPSVASDEIFRFFVPTYKNCVGVTITAGSHATRLRLEDLRKGATFNGLLYLSHIEIEKERLFLHWNIIQMKIL